MRPTFIVIGAMKAGTTSLAGYLAAHPDVFMATPKEPQFFGTYRWEDPGLAWYEQLFEAAGDARARGEASTTYTMAPHVPHVPERMVAVVPAVRLIYLIRNPIERIRSQYVHHADAIGERRPLPVMVAEEPSLLDYSRYALQLEGYLEHFPRDQILVVSSDLLRHDPGATLAGIYRFIGVDPSYRAGTVAIEHNLGARKRRVWRIADRPRAILRRAGVLGRLSTSTKRRVRRVVSSSIDAEIPPALESRIWDELTPDLARLRSIVGPGFDLWGRA